MVGVFHRRIRKENTGMSAFTEFDGRIGIRRDDRSGTYAVVVSGGPLADPVQLSAKRASPSETALRQALTYEAICALVVGEHKGLKTVSAEVIESGKVVELAASINDRYRRITFDVQRRTAHFDHPAEVLRATRTLSLHIPELADFTITSPEPDAYFLDARMLVPGALIRMGSEDIEIQTMSISGVLVEIRGSKNTRFARHPREEVQVLSLPTEALRTKVLSLLSKGKYLNCEQAHQ
jgi:hypothetical protein